MTSKPCLGSLTDLVTGPMWGSRLTFQSDDHPFLYLDGALVGRSSGVGPGSLDMVLADVFGAQPPISRAPEPSSLLLLGTTLAGIGLMVRRKLRRTGALRDT